MFSTVQAVVRCFIRIYRTFVSGSVWFAELTLSSGEVLTNKQTRRLTKDLSMWWAVGERKNMILAKTSTNSKKLVVRA